MLMISSHGKVFFSVFWDGWHKPPAQNRQHGTHNLIQFASNYHVEKEHDLPTSSRPILVAFPCAFVWKQALSLKISPFFSYVWSGKCVCCWSIFSTFGFTRKNHIKQKVRSVCIRRKYPHSIPMASQHGYDLLENPWKIMGIWWFPTCSFKWWYWGSGHNN